MFARRVSISNLSVRRSVARTPSISRTHEVPFFHRSLLEKKPSAFNFSRVVRWSSTTPDGKGCTTIGVCGKTPETAILQDLLIHQLKGISMYAARARQLGVKSDELDEFTLHSVFSTLTNVNFDSQRFVKYIQQADMHFKNAKKMYLGACKSKGIAPEKLMDEQYNLDGLNSIEQLEERGKQVGVLSRKAKLGEDITGLQEMIVYGIKGLAAYADHALTLGKKDEEVFKFIHETLDAVAHKNLPLNDLVALALKVGECNLRVMAMLEEGHNVNFGKPSPHKARISAKQGKAILVSGHDVKDLKELLLQTEGTGINVYTHGELLPAHGYPELNKHKHLMGNYGGPWQLQKIEFASFPGPIVMTSNCIVEPRKSYNDRIFTRNAVGWPGVKHIENFNYSKVIEMAKSMKGFEKDEPEKFINVGYGKHTVLSIADKVLDAIKEQKVKHFFFIGGCDGSEGERNYFKELAVATPQDTMILTAGCGKYRFNKLLLGEVAGLPKVLDMGQCNDSYGAIQIAVALANALKTDVNSLPLSFAVSWFEQKAVAVLLSLLHLGVQRIRLGPNLPGFCTPAMLELLQSKFNLKSINPNIQQEMKEMLAGR